MRKSKREIFIICLLVTLSAIAVFYVGYHKTAEEHLTQFQISGEDVYPKLIKPEDTAPLPVPPDVFKNGRAVKVPILMYHHVGDLPPKPDKTRLGLTVSTQNFQTQVAWLKEQGYQSVTLNDLYQLTQHPTSTPPNWPKKPIIFTFDDGYRDVFDNAVPILNKAGYTGAFGIITSFPGQHQGTNIYAGWEQIARAQDAGMEIICHTQNHFDGSNVKKYNSAYVYGNLSGCQQDLTNHLGRAEPYLIYPYGHYTDGYIEQAKKAGFVMAMTVHMGDTINFDDLFRLPRVRVGGQETLLRFEDILLGKISIGNSTTTTATGTPVKP